jgi:transcription elongation factor Elf1
MRKPDLNLTQEEAEAVDNCTDCGKPLSSRTTWFKGNRVTAVVCYDCNVERSSERGRPARKR